MLYKYFASKLLRASAHPLQHSHLRCRRRRRHCRRRRRRRRRREKR